MKKGGLIILIILATAVVLIFYYFGGLRNIWHTAQTPMPSPSPTPTQWINNKSDLIRVSNITAGDAIGIPVTITGEARGYWFFEASFPVKLLDGNGNQIAIGVAQAQSEWMTTEFVPFKVTLNFVKPATDNGTLVFEKDNPSGLPEHDDKLEMPIRFNSSVADGPCLITGCSGQVCSDEEIATTCEYLPQYSCYKTARCERQANGQCGWTETPELKECLK